MREPPHAVHAEETEDVFDADASLEVGLIDVAEGGGKVHDGVFAAVAVADVAYEPFAVKDFAPFQLAE